MHFKRSIALDLRSRFSLSLFVYESLWLQAVCDCVIVSVYSFVPCFCNKQASNQFCPIHFVGSLWMRLLWCTNSKHLWFSFASMEIVSIWFAFFLSHTFDIVILFSYILFDFWITCSVFSFFTIFKILLSLMSKFPCGRFCVYVCVYAALTHCNFECV